MSYITTVSGIHIDPKCPADEEIAIRDICHSLSLLCRANGHVKYFFSVAQHSINCCLEAQARGYSKRVQLACLLHDAAECYLSDVTRPIKQDLPEYQQTEEALLHFIWEKYLDQPLTEEEEALVFAVDDDMLSYEFLHMMPDSLSDRYQSIVSKPDLEFREMRQVEEHMLSLYHSLCVKVMKFRRAQPSDAVRVHDLMEKVHSQMERPELFVCDDLAFVEQHIDREGYVLLAEGAEGRLLGCLLVRTPKLAADNLGRDIGLPEKELTDVAHLEMAVVAPEARGQGIMRALISRAEEILQELGYRHILGTVSPENPASFRNLEVLGYQNMLTKEKYGGKLRRIYHKSLDYDREDEA